MPTLQQVKNLIGNIAGYEHVEVEGDGHHFFVVTVLSAFEGKTRLAHRRLIRNGSETHLWSNELHTLSTSVAVTPAEWVAK